MKRKRIRFEFYKKDKIWHWRARSCYNGQIVATDGGQKFNTRRAARNAIYLIKGHSEYADIVKVEK